MDRVFLALLVATIAGCASYSKMLINPNGQLVHCAQTGWGILGTPAALNAHDNCVASYKAAGYIELEEAGAIGIRLATTGSGPVRILSVTENSPASRAGISPGDLIISVDGQAVSNAVDTRGMLLGRANTQVSIVVRKGTEEKTVILTRAPYTALHGTAQSQKQ
jgi:carboxyl-terminal processing protease